ncbi:MAG: pro-sigmaK processing inhibitor BofA family protein [Veillonellaceae bacterium]|uniref:pro-sigmaK processing inhibitor BofA family protein n=1 Tax=Anaerovibrio lipolyticus TaxID=82374 RepID=UPI001F3ED421|nr:pro-sigmaK processing inhibitor BofA family protein [Anaerovibrio lipolyticus]MCI6910222.1 pro-sigmaK processing inhibitor BofA family protein [Veillonellaceae bacterium]MDY4485054.1 pro-sigmaK processing inhibitor BofA family protein [Anaerovibrio sp.]MCF2601973.1 pro-sigmaK processing inhibitor BofA family protein [Anaerovibrio lipolyticus]MCI7078054.1 pro-sigmaK processing inhibitor BofA family protein [Veillonellaceae bacterium]MCI7090609.1 pro-sigmaK processing inhibitor BofA family pr
MEIIGSFIVGIIVLFILLRVLSLPFRIVWKLITNSIVGALMLWVVNLFGLGIEITFFKALIAGFFGVPGVLVVVLAHFL